MEYKFEKDYLFSTSQISTVLIPKSSINRIEAKTVINRDKGIYKVIVNVYLNSDGLNDYITVFQKILNLFLKQKKI